MLLRQSPVSELGQWIGCLPSPSILRVPSIIAHAVVLIRITYPQVSLGLPLSQPFPTLNSWRAPTRSSPWPLDSSACLDMSNRPKSSIGRAYIFEVITSEFANSACTRYYYTTYLVTFHFIMNLIMCFTQTCIRVTSLHITNNASLVIWRPSNSTVISPSTFCFLLFLYFEAR